MNRRPTLRRRDEFQRAYRKGTRAFQDFLQLRYLVRGDDGPLRLGIVIRSAVIRRAVRRNRVRRMLRESIRQLLPQVPSGIDLVLITQGEPACDHQRYIDAVVQRGLRKCGVMGLEPPPWPTELPANRFAVREGAGA
ncbi:MAG: Ribonuclease P protein component [bacterium]|nr:Ribonuclease P protein component [bacterium]